MCARHKTGRTARMHRLQFGRSHIPKVSSTPGLDTAVSCTARCSCVTSKKIDRPRHYGSHMENWVLVVDGDLASKKQMDICRKHPVGLHGFIECDKLENKDASICSAVDYFPAFCHTTHHSCVYGIKGSEEALMALKGLAPSEQSKSTGSPQSSSSQ